MADLEELLAYSDPEDGETVSTETAVGTVEDSDATRPYAGSHCPAGTSVHFNTQSTGRSISVATPADTAISTVSPSTAFDKSARPAPLSLDAKIELRIFQQKLLALDSKIDEQNAKMCHLAERQDDHLAQILQTLASDKDGDTPHNYNKRQLSPDRSSGKKRFLKTVPTNLQASDSSADEGSHDGDYRPQGDANTDTVLGPTLKPANGAQPPDTRVDALPDTGDIIMEELFPSHTVVSGANLTPKVAVCVDRKWQGPLTKEDVDAMGGVIMPGNITAVGTPLLNPEIWSELPRQARSSEKRMINLQGNLQRAAMTSACTIEFLLTQEKASRKGEMVADPQIPVLMQEHMNSIALLGNVSHQLSFIRRQRLKAHVNPKIAGICDLKYEGPHKLLFGDDFTHTLTRAEQKKKVADTVTKPQQSDFRRGGKPKKPPGQTNASGSCSTNQSSNNNRYNNYRRFNNAPGGKRGKRGSWKPKH